MLHFIDHFSLCPHSLSQYFPPNMWIEQFHEQRGTLCCRSQNLTYVVCQLFPIPQDSSGATSHSGARLIEISTFLTVSLFVQCMVPV